MRRDRGQSLAEMTDAVRKLNTEKGWRTGDNTFGDYIALLHSEVSEALEAYRDHRLTDATRPGDPIYDEDDMGNVIGFRREPGKPEGVGSEFADVLIRLLDTCDVFDLKLFDMDCELADVPPLKRPGLARSFGDHMSWLHRLVTEIDPVFKDAENRPANFLQPQPALSARRSDPERAGDSG